jgi:trimeric autotransporter adhesin
LPSGEYLDRFEITFSNTTLGVDENEINTIDVFFNNDNESIVLLNPEFKDIKTIELFNILGQSIATFDDITPSANSEYKTKNLSSGTYIIKVYTDNGSFSKKVLVE